MRPLTKRLLGAVALLALVLLSAFGAGTYGFMQGYVHGLGDTSSEAATLTTTLRALRSGDLEKAMTNLEGDLDTLIIEHSVTDTGIPVFSWLTPYTHNDAA